MAAANMKAVKLRIKSVQNTMQITKAMQLVAASKLRKAKDKAMASKPYLRTIVFISYAVSLPGPSGSGRTHRFKPGFPAWPFWTR